MIWIVSSILLISLGFNFLYLRRTQSHSNESKQDKDLLLAINQVGKSGSAIPDLSLKLTNLAASNLKSAESFKSSTNDLNEILQNSVQHYNQIDEMGRKNISSIKERIDELQGFIQSIESLNKHNKSVGEAVEILENISSQTNMLALNASVEAARAGSEGKGFSVIARSVRDLASESVDASETIKTVIEQSKEQGAEIADQVARSTDSLKEIFDNITQIVDSLSEGLQSFEENSTIVANIYHSATELDSSVQNNLNAVTESSLIGIRLGIYLNDLYAQSEQMDEGISFHQEFIKPEHVFHFNFTNTLPAILAWMKIERTDFILPKNQDSKIKPENVYKTLLPLYKKLANTTASESLEMEAKTGKIQPIDVLKLSVALCELIHKKTGKTILDKQLVIQYNEWKEGRSIKPSDVLFLVNQFKNLLK